MPMAAWFSWNGAGLIFEIVDALVTTGLLGVTGYSLLRLYNGRDRIWADFGSFRWNFVIGLAVPLFIAPLLFAEWWLAARDESKTPRQRIGDVARSLRLRFAIVIWGWLYYLLFWQPLHQIHFELVAGLSCGLAALLGQACLQPTPQRWLTSSPGRAVDLTLWTVASSALLLELGLRAFAAIAPHPIFATPDGPPTATIASNRASIGQTHFGFPFNDRGYYDQPISKDQRPHLVVLGDSFSVGVVPHALHYTTVAEQRLGVALDNVGIAGIGPAEYLHLIEHELAPLRPDAIVISLFVGNDIADIPRFIPRHATLRRWCSRDNVLMFQVPYRCARIWRELGPGRRAAEPPCESAKRTPTSARGSWPLSPWLDDPSLEPPTMTEETYLHLETRRARGVLDEGASGRYLQCFHYLQAIRNAAGSIPICLLLIPDEFQVEDDLWSAVCARSGATGWRRDRPQREIAQWCAERGIPCLDLLPAFLSAPKGADGRRALYHLRDSHWNARGNRRAGEELARFLSAWPPVRSSANSKGQSESRSDPALLKAR